MKPTWKTWLIITVAVLGILFVLDAKVNATASSPNQGELTLTVSDPVPAVLSVAVRDIVPLRGEPYLARETNPIQWLGDGVGESGVPIGLDPLASRSVNGGTSPDPLVTFEGVPSISGVTPPDTNGDVGPNHYVQMTNFSFQIWDKGDPDNGIPPTPLTSPVTTGALFSELGGQCTSNFGDPVVLYDDLADRWLLSQFGLSGPLAMCIAISTTPDPTGDYYLYEIPTGPDFPDYPKLGVWPDAYYMGTNTGFPNAYVAHAFDRVAMLAGDPAGHVGFGGLANFMMPADVDGQVPPPAGDPGIFYTFYHPSGGGHPAGAERLAFYEFDVDWVTPGNSTYTLVEELPVASFNYTGCGFFSGGCVPQPGTGQLLDDLSWWPMHRLQYRNFGGYEAMVGNYTVDPDNTNRDAPRWFEVHKSGSTYSLYQEGTYDPSGDSRWMGSIAMDTSGNIALGYSVSSSSVIPSIRYATRLAGDPLGTLNAEAEMWTGGGVQTGIHRWGDYSAMTVDPVDGCTFWFTTEYHDVDDSGFGWNTRIGVFRIPTCGGPSGTLSGQVTDSVTLNGIDGAQVLAAGSLITQTGGTTTDANGVYTMTLPVGTYMVTASAFAYLPDSVSGVDIISGTTTTQNFSLDPAPTVVVEGTVTDSLMGWPLYAEINIGNGFPDNPIWTDPVTGQYSVVLPVGTYDFEVSAFVEGYTPVTVQIIVSTLNTLSSGGQTEDFILPADLAVCTAPGYTSVPTGGFSDDFESGYGNWTMTGLWNAENEADSCGSLVAPFPSSSNDAYYGQNSSCTYDNGSTNSGDLTLNSPVSVGAGSVLTFSSYEQTECGGNCGYDARQLQVSTNGGSSWTTVYDGDTENVWYQETVDLSAYAGSIMVRFHFDTSDNLFNDYFGWMVDDVSISTYTCVPPTDGGLVVGNVYDANSLAPVNGAWVTNETGSLGYAMETPLDSAVDDAFYTIYSLSGTQVHTATFDLYGEDVQSVGVVDFDTVAQDFFLPSGFIITDPTAFNVSIEFGTNTTIPLTLTDIGGGNVEFVISEAPGTNPFAPAGMHIPASDGNFPRGEAVSSFLAAPKSDKDTATKGLSQPLILSGGAQAYGAEFFSLQYVGLTLDNPGSLTNIGSLGSTQFFAGDFINGDFSTMYALDYGFNALYTIDVATGVFTEIGPSLPSGGQVWTGIAGDPTSSEMYATSTDCSANTLYTVDLGTGTVTSIGSASGYCIIGIAINASGDMYGLDIIGDSLLSIDKSTGAVSVIGSVGFDANFAQGMDFDEDADLLYLAAYNNAAGGELRIADVTTGNTVLVGLIGSGASELDAFGIATGGLGGDVPWVSEVPISGTVPANGDFIVNVTFDAAQVPIPGQYTAFLNIAVDTPQLEVTVPLTLNVTCSTCGMLEGDITDAATALPLTSTIHITSTGGFDLSIEDVTSYSAILLPGLYTVNASATGYLSETVTVNITTGVTTTQDIDLWANTSILSFSPASVEETMNIGDVVSNTVTVTNTGAASMDFEVNIGGFSGPLLVIPRSQESLNLECPPDSFGYSCIDSNESGGPAYDFEDISGTGTALTLGDDEVSSAVPLGFTFNYYGTDYTDVYVSSNGFLTFLSNQYNGCCSGEPMPTPGDPDAVIAGWWEDLLPPGGGSVQYENLGDHFIVQFTDIQHYGGGNPVTFQFKLFEGSNNIEIHYEAAPSDGGTHSGGIENQNGTVGLQYFLGSSSLTTPLAVCYLYPGQTGCGSGGSGAWAYAVPNAGTVPGFSSTTFELVFDASSLYQVGDFYATLSFDGSFINEPPTMPLTMHLSCPTCGFLVGDIYDSLTSAPVEANVYVTSDSGTAITLTGVTNYSLALQPDVYNFVVTADDYFTGTATVTVTQGVTTTTDFALVQMTAILEYSPGEFDETIVVGEAVTNSLFITNTGTVPLTFQLSDNETGSPGTAPILVSVPASQDTDNAREGSAVFGHASGTSPAWTYLDANQPSSGSTNVLIVCADNNPCEPLGSILLSYPDIGLADAWDAQNSIPTLADMLAYDVVIAWSNYPYADRNLMGDVLADYVDAGGSVVLGVFNWVDTNYWGLGGRFVNEGYNPFISENSGNHFTYANLGSYDPNHPIMEGVTAASDLYRDYVSLDPDATLVASWDDGEEFIATKGSVVAINSYTGNDYQWTGDVGVIFHNAVNSVALVDALWATENPDTATLNAGESIEVDVTFDSSVVALPGTYTGLLSFSGDFDNDVESAVLTMTVTCPACGYLDGDITDADTSAPLTSTVHITGTNFDYTFVDVTSYWAAVQPGTYYLTVSAADYFTQTAVVATTQGVTVTTDFALVPMLAVLESSPFSFELTVTLGTVVTDTLVISNTGTVAFNFTLSDIETGSPPISTSISIPASDGNFPRGEATPSFLAAPNSNATGISPSVGYQPLSLLGGAQAYGAEFFSLQFVGLTLDTPVTLTNIGPLGSSQFFAGDFINGDFATLYALDYGFNALYSIDTATGVFTQIGPSLPSGGQVWTGMAGDPTTGEMYATSTDCNANTLYTVDLDTGAVTSIGSASGYCIIGIAINASGDLYGLDIIGDNLLSIDKSTGAVSVIGSVGFDANFAQGMDFDEDADILYLAAYNNSSGTGELRIADVSTGNSVFVGFIGSGASELDAFGIATGGPSDALWLIELPFGGTLQPGAEMPVDIIFDASVITLTGTYTAEIMIDGTFDNESSPIVVVMHVVEPAAGVTVEPDQSSIQTPGTTVAYTVDVTNDGNVSDSFTLEAVSSAGWTVTLSDASVLLDPGQTVSVIVVVQVPANAADGDEDVTTVTATSSFDSSVSDSADLTTTVTIPIFNIYLPLVPNE